MSQVELIYDNSDIREFCLLELQGALETDSSYGLKGQHIGEIKRQEDGSVCMIVGIHKLNGTLVKLKRPLAVLKKLDSHECASLGSPDSDARYAVRSIIKEKFVFKSRPDVVLDQAINALPTI